MSYFAITKLSKVWHKINDPKENIAIKQNFNVYSRNVMHTFYCIVPAEI